MKLLIKHKKKIIAFWAVLLIGLGAVCVLTISVAGDRVFEPEIVKHNSKRLENEDIVHAADDGVFRIMTLNVAHGRKDGGSQLFQSTEEIISHLDDIVLVLQRENPDVVALQEADGPSFWSGNFSHVTYLAEKSGYAYSVRGAHVDGIGLSYGTAILSKHTLSNAHGITFEPSPPTFSKGYVSADVSIPAGGHKSENTSLEAGSWVKVVSVHLDFLSESVRKEQIAHMVTRLSPIGGPLVILGDFNCSFGDDTAVTRLADELGLSTYQMENNSLVTFPTLKQRIDYILISKQFEFVSYKVIPDVLSDHLGVIVEIRPLRGRR